MTDFSQNQKISPKTNYLISLSDKKDSKFFITLDKPDIISNFVSTKGFFSDLDISEISEKYTEIINDVKTNKKEIICEIMFPVHRVNFIKSLVFKSK